MRSYSRGKALKHGGICDEIITWQIASSDLTSSAPLKEDLLPQILCCDKAQACSTRLFCCRRTVQFPCISDQAPAQVQMRRGVL